MKKMMKRISKKSKRCATFHSTKTRRVFLRTLNRSAAHIQRRIGYLNPENDFLPLILSFLLKDLVIISAEVLLLYIFQTLNDKIPVKLKPYLTIFDIFIEGKCFFERHFLCIYRAVMKFLWPFAARHDSEILPKKLGVFEK